MPIVIPGPTISSISGTVGIGDNKAVLYPLGAHIVSRSYVIPTPNSTSVPASDIRAAFRALSLAWRSVTLDQSQLWQEYTLAHPRRDALGRKFIPSPKAAFIAYNFHAYILASTYAAIPYTTDVAPPSVLNVTGITLVNSTATIALTMSATPAANQKLLIRFTGIIRALSVIPKPRAYHCFIPTTSHYSASYMTLTTTSPTQSLAFPSRYPASVLPPVVTLGVECTPISSNKLAYPTTYHFPVTMTHT